jgi:Rrf2 family protein
MRLELAGKTDLALRALVVLCTNGGRLGGGELAEVLETTHHYLPQVMSPLVRQRWVTSTPGPGGGYQLLAGLDSITVLQLIEAMEGATDTGMCVLKGGTCDASDPCALHDAWSIARDALLRSLSAMSLADATREC